LLGVLEWEAGPVACPAAAAAAAGGGGGVVTVMADCEHRWGA
jgi:hypothetical protein